MPFFLAADYAAVELDFSVRIKGGLALTPRAVCELDGLAPREFGLSYKDQRSASTTSRGQVIRLF